MVKRWEAAREWVRTEWTRLVDHVWYWYLVMCHFVNGLPWDDARGEAADLMCALYEQGYRNWLEANKAWRAEVRRYGIEFAEEIRKKHLPEMRALLEKKEADIAGALKDLAALRKTMSDTGVTVWQLEEMLIEIGQLLNEAAHRQEPVN